MALRLDTFDNATGGNTLYKALTHPSAVPLGERLCAVLAQGGPVAVFDVGAAADAFDELFGLAGVDVAGTYVQDIARLGVPILRRPAAPVTEPRPRRVTRLAPASLRTVSLCPLALCPLSLGLAAPPIQENDDGQRRAH